jgi:hypothetical protein
LRTGPARATRLSRPHQAFWLSLLFLLIPALADAQTPATRPHPRADRPGGIASVGLGAAYAGTGVQLLYFQPLPLAPVGQPVALFASAAFGNHSTLNGLYTVDGQDQRLTGFSFMAGASAGRVHRLCVGAGWGALAGRGVAIEGLTVAGVTDHGPHLQAGYELLAENGAFLRLLPLGLSYLPQSRSRASGSLDYAFSVGLGWKPW